MIRVRLAPVVSLLCLLAFATPAHAGCAWVLWQETTMYYSSVAQIEWQVITGWKTRDECETKNPRTKPPFQKPNSPTAYTEHYRFVCLPDTVDPRGPKVK
jgi:hypothetical protein